jgi:hypothetical protein
MRRQRTILTAAGSLLWLALLAAVSVTAAERKLTENTSWTAPTYDEVRAAMLAWRDELPADDARREKVDALWPESARPVDETSLLTRVSATAAAVMPSAQELVSFCTGVRKPGPLPEFAVLTDDSVAPLVRNNLRLHLARWLVQNELYDEALAQVGPLVPEDVVAPATLLFHQSVAHHRLLNKQEALPRLARLMENEAAIPRRYHEVARLMAADLKPLKTDSLDEVSRLMDDVRRRLELGRAGRRVRDQEDTIIAKLDKMIEQMEQQQQQQQQQQQAGAQGGNMQPNQGLPDSVPAGGKGPGNVAQRDIGRGAGWGNLPPREREEALQEISKNLPAHYRDVIEEYFRKLARTSE